MEQRFTPETVGQIFDWIFREIADAELFVKGDHKRQMAYEAHIILK